MTLHGVIRAMTAEIEASRTKHLGVNQQTLVDLGVYVAKNAEAIAAALERKEWLEREVKNLSFDLDQAGQTLAGIGLVGFNDTPWVRRRLREKGRWLRKQAGRNLDAAADTPKHLKA